MKPLLWLLAINLILASLLGCLTLFNLWEEERALEGTMDCPVIEGCYP